MAEMPKLKLATTWTPARDGNPLVYSIELTNTGDAPLKDFKLGLNGPARLDPKAQLDGATLVERLSNHTVLQPAAGFVLEPGATWVIQARGLSYPLRHWSDGANTAYVVLADGRTVRVATTPTEAIGSNAPLLKGAVRFPVPAKVPAPISVIPWPKRVAITGSRPAPVGFDLQPNGADATAAAAAFAQLTSDLFPVEGIVRPAAEGGLAIKIAAKPGLGAGSLRSHVRRERRVGCGDHAYRHALRPDHARPDPARREAVSGPAGVPDRRHHRRRTGLRLARHASRCRAAVLLQRRSRAAAQAHRLEQDEPLPLASERGRGLARRDRCLSRAHLDRRLARLRQGAAADARAAVRSRPAATTARPRSGGSSRSARTSASRSSPRSIFPATASRRCSRCRRCGIRASRASTSRCRGSRTTASTRRTSRSIGFVETVIDEMLELFPGSIFHLGADEVPLAAWSGSPLALGDA